MLTITALVLLAAAAAALPLMHRRAELALRLRLGRLGRDLAAVQDAPAGIDPATLPSLRAQHAHLALTLPDLLSWRRDLLCRAAGARVARLEQALEDLRAGREALAPAPGVSLRTVASPAPAPAGSAPVHYSLRVPPGYDDTRQWPLIVHLHGRGRLRPFLGHPAPDYGDNALVAAPHGGGSVDFMGAAEAEVLAVIDEVSRLCRVDPDRVYLAGASMGGTGAWHLACHHPDRFAAVVACSANADDRVWEELWEEGRPEPAPGSAEAALRRLERLDSPVTYAANMLHVPALTVHGDADEVVPIAHARSMVEALRRSGAAVTFEERVGTGHDLGFGGELPRYAAWLLQHRRQSRPARVHWLTDGRWPGAYWVRRAEPSRPLELAGVEAAVTEDGTVSVQTRACRALELDLSAARLPVRTRKRLRVLVDGQDLGTFKREALALVRGEDGWSRLPVLPVPPVPPAPREAYRVLQRPFAVIFGTQAADPEMNAALRREAGSLASEWRRRYLFSPSVIADRDAAGADLAGRGLLLFGGPDENTVTAALLAEVAAAGVTLPLGFAGSSIQAADGPPLPPEGHDAGTLGCIMTAPHPRSPGEAVVVVWGASWRALTGVNFRFGNSFDWTVYENRWWFGCAVFDEKTASPETFVRVGFLGPDWRLAPELVWDRTPGMWRELPGWLPQHPSTSAAAAAAARDGGTVWLDRCLPLSVRQARGPVGFGRSWGGGLLSAGRDGRRFGRGLGVRGPGAVCFGLDGAFAAFRARVGADLEGVPAESLKAPRVEFGAMIFTVYGDGDELWASPPLGPLDEAVEVDVDVRGVGELELEVRPAGKYDWHLGCGAWAEARLERLPEP
jgi:poly(3-hydroxybutyrate) depolymerase